MHDQLRKDAELVEREAGKPAALAVIRGGAVISRRRVSDRLKPPFRAVTVRSRALEEDRVRIALVGRPNDDHVGRERGEHAGEATRKVGRVEISLPATNREVRDDNG